MRPFLILLTGLGVLASGAAEAQTRPAHPAAARPAPARPAGNGAKSIGTFEDWTAATHAEAGATVCYAFTRLQPGGGAAVPGRGDVVLTVTQRPTGRDAVAMTAGFAYPPNAEATMQVDRTELPFYTAGRSAFARDGHAVTAALEKGRTVVMHSPGPKGGTVNDNFSLRGFTAAYAAINKACPVR